MSRILAAGAARMKLEAENYEARIAALEAQLAELAAENERLKADRDFWKERFQVETRARIEALASTGAVKVKALPWQEDANGCLYAQTELGEYVAWPNGRVQRGVFGTSKVDGGIIGAKADAQSDYERRILSALEPHPRATNTVDAHETANVSDKPESQQEPVAWALMSKTAGALSTTIEKAVATKWKEQEALSGFYLAPLFTRPSEQAVTEEWRTDAPPKDGTPIYMRTINILRFHPYKPTSQQAKNGIKGRWQEMNDYSGWENCPEPVGNEWRFDSPFALKAAMEAGERHD